MMERTPYPWSALIAGQIWTVFGVLCGLTGVTLGGWFLVFPDEGGTLFAVLALAFSCCLGVGVWGMGRGVVRGETGDPMYAGLFSIALGIVPFAVCVSNFVACGAMLVLGMTAFSLMTAGVLAITGREHYLEWRAARRRE